MDLYQDPLRAIVRVEVWRDIGIDALTLDCGHRVARAHDPCERWGYRTRCEGCRVWVGREVMREGSVQ